MALRIQAFTDEIYARHLIGIIERNRILVKYQYFDILATGFPSDNNKVISQGFQLSIRILQHRVYYYFTFSLFVFQVFAKLLGYLKVRCKIIFNWL